MSVLVYIVLFCFPSLQIRSKVLSARATTMVEPLHLMLFGSSSIESSPPNLVKVDDWYDTVHVYSTLLMSLCLRVLQVTIHHVTQFYCTGGWSAPCCR